MKFEDLKLAYGYPLQLQTASVSGRPERYSCRLVGCLPGRGLLLSVPKLVGKLVRFRHGQKILVRLTIEKGIGVFACLVELQSNDPYPILYVSYPEAVTFKSIRNSTRVAVNEKMEVFSLVQTPRKPLSGYMSDISISGCRIELEAGAVELGDAIELIGLVDISGLSRSLYIKAVVRSQLASDESLGVSGLVSYGLEFTPHSDDELLVIYAYVFSRLSQQD